MRTLTLTLRAVNPPAVALTHGIGGIVGLAQPVEVMSRAAAVAIAWKNVVVTRRLVFRSRNAKPPLAFDFVEKRDRELICSETFAPATASPDCVTTPDSLTIFFFLLRIFALSVTAPGPTIDRASTVPAAFGKAVPALYGVQNEVHRAGPVGGVIV